LPNRGGQHVMPGRPTARPWHHEARFPCRPRLRQRLTCGPRPAQSQAMLPAPERRIFRLLGWQEAGKARTGVVAVIDLDDEGHPPATTGPKRGSILIWRPSGNHFARLPGRRLTTLLTGAGSAPASDEDHPNGDFSPACVLQGAGREIFSLNVRSSPSDTVNPINFRLGHGRLSPGAGWRQSRATGVIAFWPFLVTGPLGMGLA